MEPMAAVARGQTVNAASPVLTFVTVVTGTAVVDPGGSGTGLGSAGTLFPPYALQWSVFDVSTDDKMANPVQTAGPTSVDLVADLVSPGVYAVDWDCPGDEPLGLHEVRWTLTATSTSAPQTFRREFDVLRAVPALGQRGYALVSDFRREGIPEEKASDVRLQLLIEQWSGMVDFWCRRFFEPRPMSILLDGSDSTTLNLGYPLIGVSAISAVDDAGSPNPVDMTGLRFYNRHITQGMLTPDDREAPRIEFVLMQPILVGMDNAYYPAQSYRAGRWARGTQNVQVTGVFGYTDLDGSPSGTIPSLIRRAVQLLVLRNLPKLGRANERFDALHRHRITTESTRGQSYSLSPWRGGGGGGYSGDPEIDDLLERYTAPIALASTNGVRL
jgi:hypothetical protein